MKQFYSSFIQAFAALSLTVATRASPHNSLAPRDLALVDGTCQPIVYGATQIESGKVCANIDGGTLTIKYTVDPGWTIDTVHAWLGNQPATTAKPPTAPGKMPYTNENGFCTISGLVATCTVPIKPEWRVACGENLYAVTHIAHTSPAGMHETGWGKGPCYDDKGNCAKYWALKTACKCPVVIDYEPIYYTSYYSTTYHTSTVYTVDVPNVSTVSSCDDPNAVSTTAIVKATTTLPQNYVFAPALTAVCS